MSYVKEANYKTSKPAKKETACETQSTENLLNAYEPALIKTKVIKKF